MEEPNQMHIVERDHGSVVFREKFDSDRLAYILDNPKTYRPLFRDIDPKYDPFILGRKYLNGSRDGVATVPYFQPRRGVGRFYAKGSLSLQNFKRGVRHAISGEYYFDLDIVNAHPVILRQMCDEFGIECPLLTEYVERRDKIMSIMAKLTGVDASDIKQAVLCLINGGRGNFNALRAKCKKKGNKIPKWLIQFKHEATNILDEIAELYEDDYEEHMDQLRVKQPGKNPKASFNSLLMCNHENDILFSIIKFMRINNVLGANDYEDAVLCFDGCQLLKDLFPNGADDLIGMIPDCELFIFEETGFKVKLKIKPMDKGFPIPEDIPRYIQPLFSGIDFDGTDADDVLRSDTGLAKIFVRYAAQWIKCYNDDGDAFVWDAETLLWLKKSHKYVQNIVSELLDGCLLHCIKFAESIPGKAGSAKRKALQKIHQKVLSYGGSRAIYCKASQCLIDDKFIEIVNRSPHELPTRGGTVVDMKAGVSRMRTYKDLWSYELDVSFAGVDCDFTEVYKFIKPIFCFDDSLISYMQKQIGICATLELVRLLYVWYGHGRNGKSSLCKIMSSCLSRCTHGRSDAYGALSKEIFIKDSRALKGSKSQHTAHLMPLKGLRLGITSELAENERLDDDEVKRCTGGDDISVRGLNRDQEFFTPLLKMIIPTNVKPLIDASLQAIIDRMSYGPFNARFVSPDDGEKVDEANHKYLAMPEFSPDKIADHPMRDAFFTWMVMGVMEYYAEGLKPPQVIKDFKQKSLHESDRFVQFISEEFELDPERRKYYTMDVSESVAYRKQWSVSVHDVAGMYEEFIGDENNSRLSSIKISKRLVSLGIARYRNHCRMFVGLRKLKN